MTLYNLLLILGGASIMFATSNGIWNRIAPEERHSNVSAKYRWRVGALIAGVLIFMTGLGMLILSLV